VTVAHLLFSARLALEGVFRNPLRAGLTSLGILFGVASVIAMLAIGRGAKQEILAQMQLLGTNNVVITPVVERLEPSDQDEAASERVETKHVSPGLTEHDVRGLVAAVPEVEMASGEVVVEAPISRNNYRRTGKLVGVDRDYFTLVNLTLAAGKSFLPLHLNTGSPVAVIGQGVRARFFPGEEAIGKQIKVGNLWLTVIGVVEQRRVSQQVAQKLGIRDPNMDVYVPMSTMLLRVRNRAIPKAPGSGDAGDAGNAGNGADEETAEERHERLNYHQLDRAIVRVRTADYVPAVADVARRQLSRRHNNVTDFEITIPELLLKQEQRTKTIFNVVLGSIASISLVVGGIGIMNIMLASVLERIREIGVRRATGARRVDILSQFLAEAVLISLAGGIAGTIVGVTMSLGIERFAGIQTSVSPFSVALACGVSISVGLAFGIMPAWRAAEQDPVNSLRYE
jgi:putative ABC transport system permease protein